MSLASLTIDLTLGLAKFEGDSGKAAQIIVRDQSTMSRAAANFEKALQRQADQATKTSLETATIKAAMLGLGDDTLALVQKVNATGGAYASVGVAGKAAFAGISSAASGVSVETNALLTTLVAKIRDVNAQAEQLKSAAKTSNAGGSLSDDGLKAQLASVTARREAALKLLKDEYDLDVAAQKLAATETQAAEQRRAAAQKIVDAQNGLTASYRTQLAALRELRDAGALTPAQFKQAGADLVAKQPVTQQRQQEVAAAQAAAEAEINAASRAADAQVAAGQRFIQSLRDRIAAIGQTREAQLALAAANLGVSDEARNLIVAQSQREFIAGVDAEVVKVRQLSAEFGQTATQVLQLRAAQLNTLGAASASIAELEQARAAYDRVAQAAQRAEAAKAADAAFVAGINEQIAAQQRLTAEFGKTEAEILALTAAEKGLTAQTAEAIARLAASKQVNADLQAGADRTSAGNAFVQSLNQQADAIGKSRSELLALKAAQLGVTDQTAVAIARIKEFDAATGQAGKAAFGTKNQLLTLHYTLSDVVASLASGISPLTIALQQGGQVYDAFGQSTSAIFKTIGSIITPLRVAIGGTIGAVAALGYAFHEGSKESKAFADAVVLTGNFAGQTEGRFNAMARGIAASGQVSISAAREFGQALISTGEIGPKVLGAATEAAARYGAATGKNAKEVASDFASMGADVFKWATDHNKQLNFVTAAQLAQIKTLQEQGRAVEAQAIVYDALNERFRKLEPNLGTLDRAIRAVTSTWAEFWDAAYDIGRAETIESKIAKVDAQLKAFESRRKSAAQPGEGFTAPGSSAPPVGPREAERLANERNGLLRIKATQEAAAAAAAETAKINKDAADAQPFIDGFLKRSKSVDGLNKALTEANAKFKAMALAGQPVSDANQKLIVAKIREDFTDKPKATEANDQRKALLDQDIKYLKDNLAQQQDQLKFNDQVVAALYAGSNVSLKTYYDEKRRLTAAGIQDELNTLTDEQARLEVELERGAFKDPHERIQLQTQLNESVAKSANIARDAAHAATLANLEEAQSFKQLNDRVDDYHAQLLQLQGDDEGAARLRAQTAIANAKLFARQAGGAISSEDLAAQQRAIENANTFESIQRKLGLASADAARAEDLFLLRAEQGGTSLIETEQGVFAIRETALRQLGELVDKAQALAAASTDPKIVQFAADLTLQYAKAAEAIDPALTRLRDAGKELGTSLADSLGESITKFTTLHDLAKNLGTTLLQITTKAFITEPLEKSLQGAIRGFIDGSSPIAQFLKDGIGAAGSHLIVDKAGAGINAGGAGFSQAKDSAAAFDQAATSIAALSVAQSTEASAAAAQTIAVTTATAAMTSLALASQLAAQTLVQLAASSGSSGAVSSLSGLFGNTAGSGVSDVGGINAGLPAYGLAEGTDRVPYDNFLARLHKDERVVPAKFNPAVGFNKGMGNSGGGSDVIQIINNGAPMTVKDSSTSRGADGRTIRRIVVDTVTEDTMSGGPASRANQQKFGLNRQNKKRG